MREDCRRPLALDGELLAEAVLLRGVTGIFTDVELAAWSLIDEDDCVLAESGFLRKGDTASRIAENSLPAP